MAPRTQRATARPTTSKPRPAPKRAAARKPAAARTPSAAAATPAASALLDQRIRELGDWRGEALARMRALIHAAQPGMLETWKWRGTPVWEHDGIVCTGESYAKVVKLTFALGAALPDPARLFNASLEGGTRRAIDIREGEVIDARAFTALVRAAVALNAASVAGRRAPAKHRATKRSAARG